MIAPQTIKKHISVKEQSTLLLIVLIIMIYFYPNEYLFNTKKTMCLHKILFHFDCPGCGMTRALNSFLHFKFREAINFNFGVIAIIPLFALEIILNFRFNTALNFLKKAFYFLLMSSLFVIYIIRLSHHLGTLYQ